MKSAHQTNSRKYLPSHIFKDGAKWLLVPSKISIDSMSLWPENYNYLKLLLNILCISSSVLIIGGNCYNIFAISVDLVSAVSALASMFLCVENLTRIILSCIYRKKLSDILYMVYYEFWPSNIAGNALHVQIKNQSRYLFTYWAVYSCAAFTCIVQYVILPYTFSDGNTPLNTAYPFSWHKSPYFEVIYIWQSFYFVWQTVFVLAIDLFLISLLFNCVIQFRILKAYLKENFERIIQSKEVGKTEARKLIVICIRQHNTLIRACDEIDQAFSYFLLTQYLINVGTICLSSFIGTILPEEIGTAVTYFAGHMSQMFIYCYMGNELILESTELSNAAFECGWHLLDQDKDLEKSLVMIMIRSQKPLRISAGGFSFLSLENFVALVRFSFSVYTLLDSLLEK